jgi:hypothetical protein
MKSLIFSTLVGLALVSFTGCTTSGDAGVSKCQSGKCESGKCKGAKKCNGAKKCASSKKCGK